MDNPEFDIQKRARAGTTATLRAAVAAYILYLGWKIMTAVGSSVPPLLAKGIGAVFIAAALAFGVYAWKRWRVDLENARLPKAEDAQTEEEEEGEEPT